jgi:hypothetical protein
MSTEKKVPQSVSQVPDTSPATSYEESVTKMLHPDHPLTEKEIVALDALIKALADEAIEWWLDTEGRHFGTMG